MTDVIQCRCGCYWGREYYEACPECGKAAPEIHRRLCSAPGDKILQVSEPARFQPVFGEIHYDEEISWKRSDKKSLSIETKQKEYRIDSGELWEIARESRMQRERPFKPYSSTVWTKAMRRRNLELLAGEKYKAILASLFA